MARCSGAKFALIGFMDSLRIENIGNGLRVVNVCPGYVPRATTPPAAPNPRPMRATRDLITRWCHWWRLNRCTAL